MTMIITWSTYHVKSIQRVQCNDTDWLKSIWFRCRPFVKVASTLLCN